MLRLEQVFETVRPVILNGRERVGVEKFARGASEDDLAAVSDSANPGGAVNNAAVIRLLPHVGNTAMESDTDPNEQAVGPFFYREMLPNLIGGMQGLRGIVEDR